MAANLSVTFKLIDQISQRLDNIANSGEKVAEKFSSFGNVADSAFDRVTSGSDKVSSSMQSASVATAQYAEQGDRAQQALEDQATSAEQAAHGFEEYGNEAEEAGNQSEEFGERAAESSKKAEESAMSLGDALAAAGVVAALKQMVDAYNEFDTAADQFETAMAKVGTIADPAAASLEDLQGQIQDLSKETGVAVTDLSESVYSAISASVDTAKSVEFVAQANALAVGGFTQTATSVDILTTILNAYKLEADQTQSVADKLIMTQNLGKTTVDELGSSMGKVIPTANSLNVNLDQLCGAYAVMTANGIATAETTTYLNSMLNELGKNGTAAADAFAAGTEHIKAGGLTMAEAMADGWGLTDVLSILDEQAYVTGTSISNMFGSAEAGKAANVLWSNAEKVDKAVAQMGDSAGAANSAFEKMSATGEFVEKKWDNALENLKIAIGDAQPSLDGLMSKGTDIINKVSEFVSKNPQLVGAIEGAALALGVFTAAVTAYTVAVKLAKTAQDLFAASMPTNPIFLTVTAIAALTAGVIAFVSTCDDAESSQQRLTAASQDLSDEIARQEERVAALAGRFGETDERTIDAKARLGELKAEFEATGQTMEAFQEQVEATYDKIAEESKRHSEAVSAIEEQASGSRVLIAELQRLESQTELTAFQQEYMKQIVGELNETYPELGLNYDETTGKLNKTQDSLKKYCEQLRQQQRLEEDKVAYVEKLKEQEALTEELATANENLTRAQEDYNRALEDYNNNPVPEIDNGLNAATQNLQKAQAQVDQFTESIAGLEGEMAELDARASEAAASVEEISESASDVISTTDSLKEAMQGVFDGVSEQAEELAAAYQEAYDAAASAVDSSFGMFEKIKLESSKSTEEMIAAWESQAKYLDEYNANLEKAKSFGLDSGLVEGLADGSQESAAALDTIVKKIEDLGGSTEKAKEYIAEMNESFATVQESKNTLEDTMVEMNTTLQKKMEDLKNSVKTGVDGLNLSEEAASAARETIDAYIKEIESQGSLAVSAADKVASSVASALSKINIKGATPGHADGTTYGESVYIAGEYGPELIVGRQGSEVFPASETAKILSAVMNNREEDREVQMAPQEITTIIKESTDSTNTNTENRNVTLTISGKGSLDIGQSVSKRDLGAYIAQELEGAIMNILSREMYDEGVVAREF